jgi:Polyketide cyclase / dehydrase and lipid transport
LDSEVLTDIEIDRPRSEVADYVSNPENATAWSQNINKVEWKSPKPLSAGSEVAFEAEFMDRTLEYTYQVTEYTPGESLVMSSTSGPFPMETSYRFSDTPTGGTKREAPRWSFETVPTIPTWQARSGSRTGRILLGSSRSSRGAVHKTTIA